MRRHVELVVHVDIDDESGTPPLVTVACPACGAGCVTMGGGATRVTSLPTVDIAYHAETCSALQPLAAPAETDDPSLGLGSRPEFSWGRSEDSDGKGSKS